MCGGDLGFAQAKKYDLEVWSAGQKRWLEVSSCSNFEAFQARRAQIRFRAKETGKPELVHTINGSGLAVPRVLAALLENNLAGRRRVKIPAVLVPYFGKEYLTLRMSCAPVDHVARLGSVRAEKDGTATRLERCG